MANKPMTINSKLLLILALGSASVSTLCEARVSSLCNKMESVIEAEKMEDGTECYVDLQTVAQANRGRIKVATDFDQNMSGKMSKVRK